MSLLGIDPIAVRHVLPLISAFGLYAVSMLMTRSGHAQAFVDSRSEGAFRLLPDGATLVQTLYTGIKPVDSYLADLQFIFVPLVDGSSIELSLLGWHWAGLLLAVFAVMLVESVRMQIRYHLVLFTFWGLAMQYCGFFITMPMYCYVHLHQYAKSTSSAPNALAASSSSLGPSETAIRTVPAAILLGYVVPSVAMCAPWVHSGQSRQLSVAIWQNFPAWIAIFHAVATGMCSADANSSGQGHTKTNDGDGRPRTTSQQQRPFDDARAAARAEGVCVSIRRVYGAVAVVCAVVHISGFVPLLLASFWPSCILSRPFYLNLTAAELQALHLRAFLLPRRWDGRGQISGMAEGARNFLQYDYYIGTAAALLWVVLLRLQRSKEVAQGQENDGKGRFSLFAAIRGLITTVASIVTLGPGFTMLRFMSRRESGLLEICRDILAAKAMSK